MKLVGESECVEPDAVDPLLVRHLLEIEAVRVALQLSLGDQQC